MVGTIHKITAGETLAHLVVRFLNAADQMKSGVVLLDYDHDEAAKRLRSEAAKVIRHAAEDRFVGERVS